MKPIRITQTWLRQNIHERRILDLIDNEFLSVHTGLPLLAIPSSIDSKMALFDTMIPIDMVGSITINEIQAILPLRAIDINSNMAKFIESIDPVFEVTEVHRSQPIIIEFYYLIQRDLLNEFFNHLQLLESSNNSNFHVLEYNICNTERESIVNTTNEELIRIRFESDPDKSLKNILNIKNNIRLELYDQFSICPMTEYIPPVQQHLCCKIGITKYALGGSDFIQNMINRFEIIHLDKYLQEEMISSIIQGLNNFIYNLAENHGHIINEIKDQLNGDRLPFSLRIEGDSLVVDAKLLLSKIILRDETRLDIKVLSELVKLNEGTNLEDLVLSITTLLLVYWLWSKSNVHAE